MKFFACSLFEKVSNQNEEFLKNIHLLNNYILINKEDLRRIYALKQFICKHSFTIYDTKNVSNKFCFKKCTCVDAVFMNDAFIFL